MQAISGLLEQAQQEYPQKPAGDDDRWWPPAHLGGTAPTPEEAEVLMAEERARKAARAEAKAKANSRRGSGRAEPGKGWTRSGRRG